jgi:hypothetical protein
MAADGQSKKVLGLRIPIDHLLRGEWSGEMEGVEV